MERRKNHHPIKGTERRSGNDRRKDWELRAKVDALLDYEIEELQKQGVELKELVESIRKIIQHCISQKRYDLEDLDLAA